MDKLKDRIAALFGMWFDDTDDADRPGWIWIPGAGVDEHQAVYDAYFGDKDSNPDNRYSEE